MSAPRAQALAELRQWADTQTLPSEAASRFDRTADEEHLPLARFEQALATMARLRLLCGLLAVLVVALLVAGCGAAQ